MTKAKILIVEDDWIVAEDIKSSLKKLGFVVSGIVAYGEQALEKVRECRPDLVLMDIMLKGEMNGTEAADQIQSHINIPVVYLTAYTDDNVLDRAKVTEPFGYVIKPFEDRELNTAIEIALYKHKMETKLKQSEALLAETGRMAKISGWEVDAKTLEVSWTELIFSIPEFPVSYKPKIEEVIKFFHPDDSRKMETAVQKALDHGEPYDMEIRYITAEGKHLWAHTICKPITVDGKTVKLTGTFQDINERKQAEGNKRLFRELLNQSNDAIFIIEPESACFLDVNAQACISLGYTREELLHMKVVDIEAVIPDHLSWEAHLMEIRKKGYMILEGEHRQKNGSTIFVEINTKIIDHDGNEYIIAVSRDLTERKHLEAQLQQAQKMESIGTLAGGIAHDFNNILYPIIGFAEMSMDEAPEDTDIRENLEEILHAAMRAKNLVQQILTFGRQTEAEHKPFNIQYVLKEAIKFIRASIPSTIEIVQHIDKDGGVIMGDSTQIHQVVTNLCTNAYHAMQEKGGRLEVVLKTVNLESDDVANKIDLKPGEHSLLKISDTGRGIPREVRERIFDPFFTTKEVGKGTGLGLSVTHGIVKNHGGYISIDSETGKGTTIHVYLPLARKTIRAMEVGSDEPYQTGTGRILLVDDEETIVRLESKILEKLGYKVTGLTSSADVLDTFKKKPDNFDIVLTDMTMPRMTGLELSRKLLSIRSDIPIILCTGYNENITEEKAKAAGIREFILKPFRKTEISKKIQTLMDHRGKEDRDTNETDTNY